VGINAFTIKITRYIIISMKRYIIPIVSLLLLFVVMAFYYWGKEKPPTEPTYIIKDNVTTETQQQPDQYFQNKSGAKM